MLRKLYLIAMILVLPAALTGCPGEDDSLGDEIGDEAEELGDEVDDAL